MFLGLEEQLELFGLGLFGLELFGLELFGLMESFMFVLDVPFGLDEGEGEENPCHELGMFEMDIWFGEFGLVPVLEARGGVSE